MEGTSGKQSFGSSESNAKTAYARTATHIYRMVFLEACGVDPEHWPGGGGNTIPCE